MSYPIKRAKEIVHGLKWALQFDNGLEIIANRHLFRRRDPITLKTGGVLIVVKSQSSDIHAVKDVLFDKMYDAVLKTALASSSDFFYINLGANIGTFDLRLLQLARERNATVRGIGLEMNPTAFARFIVNLEVNGMAGTRPVNAALQEADGFMTIDAFARDTGQKAQNMGNNSSWIVPALSWTTLWNDLPREKEVNLLKVDVEGAEQFFLTALNQEQAAKIRHIAIETHTPELHRLCDEKLGALGFKRFDSESSDGKMRLSFWKNQVIAGS